MTILFANRHTSRGADLRAFARTPSQIILQSKTNHQMKTIQTLVLILGASSLFAADSSKPFPATIKTCVVSGEKLDSMGKPYVFTHEGQEVKFCCKNCLKDFKKDPAKYMKIISDAAKK